MITAAVLSRMVPVINTDTMKAYKQHEILHLRTMNT